MNICSVLEELLDHFILAVPEADHVHVILVFFVKTTASQHDGQAQVDVCSLCNEQANQIEMSVETSSAKSGNVLEAQRVYIHALLEKELDDVQMALLARNEEGRTSVIQLCIHVYTLLEEELGDV